MHITPTRIEQSALESMREKNVQRRESTEKDSKQIGSMVLELNQMLRGEAAERVHSLSSQATGTAARIATLWAAREQYRLAMVHKVEAQKLLLEKQAADLAALTAAADQTAHVDLKDKKAVKAKPSSAARK